jgi:hypothetical protein
MVSPSSVQSSFAVRVGRQIGVQEPDRREDRYDPAVATILAPALRFPLVKSAAPDITKSPITKNNQGRVREEGGKPAPAENGKPEKGKGP